MSLRSRRPGTWVLVFGLGTLLSGILLVGCDTAGGLGGTGGGRGQVDVSNCTLNTALFRDGGVGKDGIPALSDPRLIGAAEVDFLADDSRVISVVLNGEAVAVPHEILWYHEIVNLNLAGRALAVTYCPLTGSSMVFDRAVVQGAALGVSGLLFQSNLTMYDRNTDESLWPQMMRKAGCGERVGTVLPLVASLELTWSVWRTLYPDGSVLSDQTGSGIPYSPNLYPYQDYERLDSPPFVQVEYERVRPPKERLLGIFDGEGGGMAFPYLALDSTSTATRVVHAEAAGIPVVVFWSKAAAAAAAFVPEIDGSALTFEAEGQSFRDAETGSRWRFNGVSVAGPLAGRQLTPVAGAYTAFWFAWSAFQPDTEVWTHAGADG